VIGTLLFLVPLGVWARYAQRIASAGGLFAFVEAAAGLTVARIQAAFWIFSYTLYLVYTGPYIVYDLLPVVFPGITPYQPALLVIVALVVAASLLAPLIVTLWIVTAMAIVQVGVALGLTALSLAHLGVPPASFIGHGDFAAVLQGAGTTSLLYICASLPLFLGGEVRGAPRTVRQGVVWAFAGVAALVVIASIPLAGASRAIVEAPIPGVTLAGQVAGRGFAVVVGLGVAVSVAGLVIAEFIALSRLLSVLFTKPTALMVRLIATGLVAATLLSLLNPRGVYTLLLRPSLVALWISQLLVVAVYPWFVARHRTVRAGDIGLAAAASALMMFGLYAAAFNPLGT
jgi:amino acid transporter